MRLRTTIGSALLSLTTATGLSAQVTFKTTGYELRDALADVVHIWTSPFHSEPRDWAGVLGVAAGAGAISLVDDQVDLWIVRHPNAAVVKATTPWNEEHPEFGDLSTGQRLLPISGVLIVSGMVSGNRKLREAGWGCLSGWQSSSTIREVLYATVSRGDPTARSFSLIYLKAGRVIALDCVNMVRDYVQGRGLVVEGKSPDPVRLADTNIVLKEL